MRRKPQSIAIGRAYRLYAPFSRKEPSEAVVLVTEIKHPTKTSRYVMAEWLVPGSANAGFGYSELMQRVHSEVPVQ